MKPRERRSPFRVSCAPSIKIGKLAKQIGTLNKQLGGAEAKLKKLQASRKPILASLREQAKGLEVQLKQQYKTGKLPRLQLLLTQRDPEQVSRMLQYYDRINQTLADKLQHFRDDLVKLDQAEEAIRSTQQTVFDRRDALQKVLLSLRPVAASGNRYWPGWKKISRPAAKS
ncbi:hypothetical protein [Aliamphritea spongicola]|nr:hypothetical protein [Aliamphritea spongicola]